MPQVGNHGKSDGFFVQLFGRRAPADPPTVLAAGELGDHAFAVGTAGIDRTDSLSKSGNAWLVQLVAAQRIKATQLQRIASRHGTEEVSIIHDNNDPCADVFYSMSPAFVGLVEAACATGEEKYARAADKVAEFFVRVQVRSESHPDSMAVGFEPARKNKPRRKQ